MSLPALVIVVLVAVGGCGADHADDGPATATHPIPTLTAPTPPPPGPPSGRLVANVRQHSRDAAVGQFQVWILNDRARDYTPTSIHYRDPRLRVTVEGDRMRTIPARSERGYSFDLPEPDCTHRSGSGTVVVHRRGDVDTLRVADVNDTIEQYVAQRCLELAVNRIADLRFTDVEVDGSGTGTSATLVMEAHPTGRNGWFVLDAVNGTPVIAPSGSAVWHPRTRVDGTGSPQRIELPAIPARCDSHAFQESGGATAFRLHLRVGGHRGEVILRMSPRVAEQTITWALTSCGLE
ncbi:hypothetical protein [Nocardioides jensenii]|uniref:hypothetical protein n=1 Tax=Nocardioides jensenii TaxID=1843 RepID=UPI0012F96A8F|nr:hypothetical protein [Nocardioides jensenii]